MQHCKVNINILPYGDNKTLLDYGDNGISSQTISSTVTIEKFEVNQNLNCGESLLTLATTENKHIFHFCSKILPNERLSFKVNSTRLVLENTRRGWATGDEIWIKVQVNT